MLLVRERAGRNAGDWNLPGGRVREGETLAGAAERETVEESGVAVRATQLVAVRHRSPRPGLGGLVAVVFAARPTTARARVSELESRWFTVRELANVRLVPCARRVIEAKAFLLLED